MRAVRVYMQGGWTIQEADTTMQDVMGVPGYVSYWIVSPGGTDVCSFSTKKEARLYWRKHQKELLAMRNVDNGRKLAEACGLDWEELSDFEREAWTRMAAHCGDDREGPVAPAGDRKEGKSKEIYKNT